MFLLEPLFYQNFRRLSVEIWYFEDQNHLVGLSKIFSKIKTLFHYEALMHLTQGFAEYFASETFLS